MTTYTIRSGGSAHPETILLQLLSSVLSAGGVKDLSDTDHFKVYENSAGADMDVEIQPGRAVAMKGENSYPVYSDDDELVTISANASGQARIDAVVAYVDLGETPNADSTNVVKYTAVAGTPAGSPSAPSNSDIETAIGANNPYIRLANVAVANGASSITDANITDTRTQVSLLSTGDGWSRLSGTITRGSASDPEYTIVIAGLDLSATLGAGFRIKWTQNSTVRYAIITKVVYAGGNTTITVYGGTDYDVLDTSSFAISDFHYSAYKAPLGFPLNPDKWTVEVKDTTLRNQSSPTVNQWYNVGSQSISIPTGAWSVEYQVASNCARSTAGEANVYTTLSTANNSESDTEFTSLQYGNDVIQLVTPNHRQKYLEVAAATLYYLNFKTTQTGVAGIGMINDASPMFVKAISAYL